MKRIWVGMLALGLMTVLSGTALAVDVKFSGEFYAAGMYLDKTTLNKNSWTDSEKVVQHPGPSTAFYYQRLRVRTDFVVHPGLTLITRFDAMERAWGASRSASMISDGKGGYTAAPLAADSSGTVAENENIAIDWAYVNYKAPIGVFNVGIMNKGTTGTGFGNNIAPAARIKYAYTYGPFIVEGNVTKLKENSSTANNPVKYTDADGDEYGIEGIYTWKTGKAGLSVTYARDASKRPKDNYQKNYWQFTPYAFAKFGPVALQTEINYVTGKERSYDSNNANPDIKLENLSAYVDALADFGIAYVGGSVAYVSGEDPGTDDKREGGTLTGGRDWQPALIMWNYERTNWAGALQSYDAAAQDTRMANGYLFQIRGGVRPISDLNIMASVTYANADKKPKGFLYNAYGYEVDLTATYKITNNLSYMLGAGYLFAGDYYKGTADGNQVSNDFLVLNKLTLTF